MKLGIMQPYLFPYIGYFQLIKEVDLYVLTGDLQYIRHGWINRNQIFVDGTSSNIHYFSFPIVDDDYKLAINQREYKDYSGSCNKLYKQLKIAYGKSINFSEGMDVIFEALRNDSVNVAEVNIHSVRVIAKYLGIDTKIYATDEYEELEIRKEFIKKGQTERIIYLCQYYKADTYINAIGGRKLYSSCDFDKYNINLGFLVGERCPYNQNGKQFVDKLSIIDVIMNNKLSDTKRMIDKYVVQY